MKKVLFLLLVTSISYGQALFDKGIKITGGITTENTAVKVVVQSANNVLNTISKVDLQDAFYFASASNFPVTGITDKLYIARDNNILYRFNGTIYVPMSADVSGKEDIANKSSSFTASSTVTYANTKALVDGLATKQNILTNPITGTGTTNFFPIFTSSNTLVSSAGMRMVGNTVEILSSGGSIANAALTVRGTGAYQAINFYGGPAINDTNLFQFGQFNTGQAYFFNVGNERISFFTSSLERFTVQGNGNLLVGSTTDNTQGKLQVNGNITASPATLSNQVVVKSQSDLKADLASPALTGTPTAPTATVGTNTTQVATTAFVLANGSANAVLLTGDQTIVGTKTFNTSVGSSILVNNNGSGQSVSINNNSAGEGLRVTNSVNGVAVAIVNASSQSGLLSSSTSSGNSIVANVSTSGSGFNFVGQNNSTNTFTVDKFGFITASNLPIQLKDFFTDANNTGTTETDLFSYTTLANRLNATGEKLVAVYAGTFNDATASSQIKVVYGGQTIGDTGALTMSVTGAWIVNSSIMRTGATTARAMVSISTPGASTASYTKYTSLTGLTFTGTNILKITGTAGGATGGNDDITASYGNILWQPAAL